MKRGSQQRDAGRANVEDEENDEDLVEKGAGKQHRFFSIKIKSCRGITINPSDRVDDAAPLNMQYCAFQYLYFCTYFTIRFLSGNESSPWTRLDTCSLFDGEIESNISIVYTSTGLQRCGFKCDSKHSCETSQGRGKQLKSKFIKCNERLKGGISQTSTVTQRK